MDGSGCVAFDQRGAQLHVNPPGPCGKNSLYIDAMSIVKKFGKPVFFVTMTANPCWPEIVDNLSPGSAAQGNPDLVARVFRMKLTVRAAPTVGAG